MIEAEQAVTLNSDHMTYPTKSIALSDLPRGVVATVQSVASCQGERTKNLVRRLAELGFLPGETVKILRRAAGGEPLAIRIGNSTFALRKHEADCVTVFFQSAART